MGAQSGGQNSHGRCCPRVSVVFNMEPDAATDLWNDLRLQIRVLGPLSERLADPQGRFGILRRVAEKDRAVGGQVPWGAAARRHPLHASTLDGVHAFL